MWLRASHLMRGILSQRGWSDFKIDENGAAELQVNRVPEDLSAQLEKAVAALTKQYRRAGEVLKAIAALSCSVVQPE